ncbi:MAG: nucleotidyltransferase family protein [Omnitrophica bacterium]|nr:nucleotidyltransferase family protein [Candidatus Omnitrophota bacterium]
MLKSTIVKDLDWGSIVDNSQEQGMSCLLYRDLKNNNKEISLPDGIRKELKENYFNVSATNIFIFSELNKILKGFSSDKISVLVLKSAALLEEVYADIGAKEISDIDFLIKKDELFKIDVVLRKLGFEPYCDWSKYLDVARCEYINSIIYLKGQGKIPIVLDLHWHIVNTTFRVYSYADKFNMDKFWEKAEKNTVAGVDTLVLAPHHLLIHACEHLLSHSYQRLVLFYDIFKIIDYYENEINWKVFIEDAGKFGIEKTVYYGLYFARELTGAQVPKYVLDSLVPVRFSYPERKIINLIKKGKTFGQLRHFFYFFLCTNSRGKIEYIWRSLFPPREMLVYRYKIPLQSIRIQHYLLQFKKIFQRIFDILT